MIVVRLKGGLGNQLFQYAIGRALVNGSGGPLMLDTTTGFRGDPYRRTYRLHHFNIAATPADACELQGISRIARFQGLALRELEWFWMYRLGSYHIPKVFRLPICSHVYLDGYWQSELYFKHIEQIIRKEFTVVTSFDKRTYEYAKLLSEGNSISVHVRHENYVMTCPRSYYVKAVERMSQRVEKPLFVIFSDDAEWVAENLDFVKPSVMVSSEGEDRDVKDLWLMSLCRHHIIANSTFSWWGAWLGQHPEKQVIGPRLWSNPRRLVVKHVLPPEWEAI